MTEEPKGAPLPDPATLDERQSDARIWFETLQGQIHTLFETLEAEAPAHAEADRPGRFVREPWRRTNHDGAPGGGGIMGLLGGFATPIMLSTGSDRPIALFSYLLVLDGALLFVAHKRRWPALALLSLLGTVAYEGLWIGTRMGGSQLFIGMTGEEFAAALSQQVNADGAAQTRTN